MDCGAARLPRAAIRCFLEGVRFGAISLESTVRGPTVLAFILPAISSDRRDRALNNGLRRHCRGAPDVDRFMTDVPDTLVFDLPGRGRPIVLPLIRSGTNSR